MSKFDDYLNVVELEAIKLLKEAFKNASKNAEEIFKEHLDKSEERLKRWSRLLATGDITKAEYEWLINKQITLTKMRLNTGQVIAKKRAIVLRDKLRALFIDSAIEVFL